VVRGNVVGSQGVAQCVQAVCVRCRTCVIQVCVCVCGPGCKGPCVNQVANVYNNPCVCNCSVKEGKGVCGNQCV